MEETALTPERQAELDKNCKTTCIRKLVTSNGRCRENLGKLLDKRNYRDQFSAMMAEVLQDPDVKAFIAENEEVLTEADIQKAMRNYMSSSKKSGNSASMIHP